MSREGAANMGKEGYQIPESGQIQSNLEVLRNHGVVIELQPGHWDSGSFAANREFAPLFIGARVVDGTATGIRIGSERVDARGEHVILQKEGPNGMQEFNVSDKLYVANPKEILEIIRIELENNLDSSNRSLAGLLRLGKAIETLIAYDSETYKSCGMAFGYILEDAIDRCLNNRLSNDIAQLEPLLNSLCSVRQRAIIYHNIETRTLYKGPFERFAELGQATQRVNYILGFNPESDSWSTFDVAIGRCEEVLPIHTNDFLWGAIQNDFEEAMRLRRDIIDKSHRQIDPSDFAASA